MDYINAATLFESLVMARGLHTSRDEDAVFLFDSEACLRLRPIDCGVALEITHGPVDCSETFWLDLYSDRVASDGPTLADCIEYGLELMMRVAPQSNEKAEQGAAPNRMG